MTMRRIAALDLPDAVVGKITGSEPIVSRARPQELLVDEEYQRNLSARSVKLIRNMVQRWDWTAFSPPLCVRVNDQLHCIDGQHTAIAAATHPLIEEIMILISTAPLVEDRARAFVGRNFNRIIVTPNQLFYAALASKDANAMQMNKAAADAGVKLLKQSPGSMWFKPGDCIAISTVAALMKRVGQRRTTQVLAVCASAKMAPITAGAMLATEYCLFKKSMTASQVLSVLRIKAIECEADARVAAIKNKIPMWQAFGDLIVKRGANAA